MKFGTAAAVALVLSGLVAKESNAAAIFVSGYRDPARLLSESGAILRDYSWEPGSQIDAEEAVEKAVLSPDKSYFTYWAKSVGFMTGYRYDVRTGEHLGSSPSPSQPYYLYPAIEGELLKASLHGSEWGQLPAPPHPSMTRRSVTFGSPTGRADYLVRDVYLDGSHWGSTGDTFDVLFDLRTGVVRQVFDEVLALGPGPMGRESRLYARQGNSIIVYDEVLTFQAPQFNPATQFNPIASYPFPANTRELELANDGFFYFVGPEYDENTQQSIPDSAAIRRMDPLTGEDLGVFAVKSQFDQIEIKYPSFSIPTLSSVRTSTDGFLYVQHGSIEGAIEVGTAFTKFDLTTGEKVGGFVAPKFNSYIRSWEIVEGIPEPSSVLLLACGGVTVLGQLTNRRRSVTTA
ncbi:hypothetical protein [Posidoniimonas polymericola]|uniref:hypothetical protein n=1 Tax=Posidoniimonas polymericola TaxID=2528002 RepID=UPI0011B826E5|nr:hypothetical protein [Posidoniimonas polymericola]